MMKVILNRAWCKGCYLCVELCPHDVLEINTQSTVRGFHPVWVAHPQDCSGCRLCELLCPDLAIQVKRDVL